MFSQIKRVLGLSRDFLTLLSGTTVSQAIPVLISPLLTRIYTPDDFGVFALYLSFASILSVIATGRYEMAIMLPDNREEVKSILRLIITLMLSIALVTVIAVLFLNPFFAEIFGNEQIPTWLYFLPLSILFISTHQTLSYLLIREKEFPLVAKTRVALATTVAVVKLVSGFIFKNSFGLLLGNWGGYLVAITLVLKRENIQYYLKKTSISIRRTAQKYKDFPRYDVPAIMVNLFANQLPLLLLGKYFGLDNLGFYSLTYKVLLLPVSLISTAILDMFKQQATEYYNKYGNCEVIYKKTFKQLFWLGLPIFLTLGILAPKIFGIVYGSEWQTSGVFAQIMVPMIFFKFVVSPLSYTFYVVQKQDLNFYGQLLLLGLTAFALYFGIKSDDVQKTLLYITLVNILIYSFYLYFSFVFSQGRSK